MEFSFTSLEKKAITKVMIDLAHADNTITVGENAYFEQIVKILGITADEFQEAQLLSVIGCLSVLRNMNLDNKNALLFIMRELINIDGSVHDEEMNIFLVVCQGADLPVPEN
jgi:uncharacterized tellurite resistance protein B-like protein